MVRNYHKDASFLMALLVTAYWRVTASAAGHRFLAGHSFRQWGLLGGPRCTGLLFHDSHDPLRKQFSFSRSFEDANWGLGPDAHIIYVHVYARCMLNNLTYQNRNSNPTN